MKRRNSKAKRSEIVKRSGSRPPNITFFQLVLNKVRTLSKVLGKYNTHVALIAVFGIPCLQLARSEAIMWIGSILILAMCLPLVERFLPK